MTIKTARLYLKEGQHIESDDILEYLDQAFPQKPLIPTELHDKIVQDLREEDDLHIDIRNLAMRFVIPKILPMKKPESLNNFTEANGKIEGSADSHKALRWNPVLAITVISPGRTVSVLA